MAFKSIDRAIIGAGIVGVLVSTYALYVEMAAEMYPGYKAMCDLSERASCSRVLTSKYSKGFGVLPKDSTFMVPNCIYGTIFYCLNIFLATFDHSAIVWIQLSLAVSSLVSCVYLAYLLIFVLKDFCLVCVSTYVINAILTYLVSKKRQLIAEKNK